MYRCAQTHGCHTRQPQCARRPLSTFHGSRLTDGSRLIGGRDRNLNCAWSRSSCLICKAAKSLYEVLGLESSASQKDIKSAFKKKALKLHPDVNKAPDARERFMEAQHAYQTLSNADTRADYDRKRRMDTSSSSFGSSWSPNYSKQYDWNPKQAEEELYSLADVLRDLGREFETWSRARPMGEPKSLWEDLGDLGLEFVEFLENEIGIEEERPASQSKRREPPPRADSSASQDTPKKEERPKPPPRKSPDEEIDDMLERMKRDLGL